MLVFALRKKLVIVQRHVEMIPARLSCCIGDGVVSRSGRATNSHRAPGTDRLDRGAESLGTSGRTSGVDEITRHGVDAGAH